MNQRIGMSVIRDERIDNTEINTKDRQVWCVTVNYAHQGNKLVYGGDQ